MSAFKARMQELARLAGGPTALSKKSGVPLRTIRNYMDGTSEPGRDKVLKLATGGEVSLDWLASGKGEPRDENATPGARLKSHSRALQGELRAEEPRAGYVYIPLFDVRAAAGAGAVPAREAVVNELAFQEEWIRRSLHVAPSELRLVHVEGDSMEPDLRAGDIILINHSDRSALREGIYVIRMDGALLVKQLQRLPGGVLRVISRNPAYQPFEIDASRAVGAGFDIIGRVVWACRRL